MSHSHSHSHSHGPPDDRRLAIAFLLNLAFTLLEIGGGLWTNSVAILTDAFHDGGDCLSLGLAWYLHRISQRQADAKLTYGYRRLSNVGALFTSVVLITGLSVVAWHALERLREPVEVYAPGMMGFAVIGVLMNGAAAWKLRGGHSLNERMATWHLLEDTLGWVAVLVGSAAMTLWDLPIIDPLLALSIAVFIIWNVFRNLKQVAMVFLQSAPSGFDRESVDRELSKIPGVIDSHHTHTWTLDGESHVFSTHLVMEASSSREQIVAAKQHIREQLGPDGFAHISVDVELEGEVCDTEP